MSSTDQIRVLHLVGGKSFQGGTASVVRDLVEAGGAGVSNWIWVHRDCLANRLPLVRKGIAKTANASIITDVAGATRDIFPLLRTMRELQISILHAHTRLGIFVGWLAHVLTRKPLIVHFHFLARQCWLYRFLIRTADATAIYNSRVTCEHYGGQSDADHVIMPTLEWPDVDVPESHSSRVVAASALYPNKHLDAVISACALLATEEKKVNLLIFGRTPNDRNGSYQRRVVKMASDKPFLQLEDWDLSWTAKLRNRDLFVHLGKPESFGLVILEAFSRGLRLVVLTKTFLEDLPPEIGSAGVYRAASLDVRDVADSIAEALTDQFDAQTLRDLRATVAHKFSKRIAAERVSAIYQSLA